MVIENHSIIEQTVGAGELDNPKTKLKVIDGLQEVLRYERLQVVKQDPETDPDYLLFVDRSEIDQPPQLDS